MKTYLIVWFSTDGKKVSEANDRLMSMGFRPVTGNYDYAYDWGKKATPDDALAMGDRVKETLKGCGVTFKLETV